MNQPECPECEKLSKVSDESNKIGEFLDWLNSRGVCFCVYNRRLEMFQEHELGHLSFTDLLAEYFEIDLDKVEKERRALLAWLQEQNKETKCSETA